MDSKFTGGAFSLFFHRLAVLLVSVCTLFIAYPFMHCWFEKWRCQHTYVDHRQLTFDGHGAQLIGKAIVWGLLTIITVGIYSFWLSVKMKKWTVSHTHFQEPMGDSDAAPEKSEFTGGAFSLFFHCFAVLFASSCTLFILYPFLHCWFEKWECQCTYINGHRLTFNGHGAQLIGKAIVWALLTIVTIGIYSFWLAVKMMQWTVSHTHFKEPIVDSAAALEKPSAENAPSEFLEAPKEKEEPAQAETMQIEEAPSSPVPAELASKDQAQVELVPCRAGFALSVVATALSGVAAMLLIFTSISSLISTATLKTEQPEAKMTFEWAFLLLMGVIALIPFFFQLKSTLSRRNPKRVKATVVNGALAWSVGFLCIIAAVILYVSDCQYATLIVMSIFFIFDEAIAIALVLSSMFLLFVKTPVQKK